MTQRWPHPGDDRTIRARKVALSYRQLLMERDPLACKRMDDYVNGVGETWIVPMPMVHDLDQLLTPGDAARLLHCSPDNIRRLRIAGRLVGTQDDKGHWWYRGYDVLAVTLTTRTRVSRA